MSVHNFIKPLRFRPDLFGDSEQDRRRLEKYSFPHLWDSTLQLKDVELIAQGLCELANREERLHSYAYQAFART